jgi:hypothetical protein
MSSNIKVENVEEPKVMDLYDYSKVKFNLENPLSQFQKEFVLSVFQRGTSILEARFVREDRLPCPVRIILLLPDNSQEIVFLRRDAYIGGIEREAKLLPILHENGLPVPRLIAGPVYDPNEPELGPMIIIGELPGDSILNWSWDLQGEDLKLANKLVVEGVSQLHSLTEVLIDAGAEKFLPKNTLQSELQHILDRGGPWFEVAEFREAVELLIPIVENIKIPLVFSSGDYNHGNYLIHNRQLSGIIDFAWACFEDPIIGFAKYWTYDWYPLNKAGIVEYYLETHNLTMEDFAPRLAIRSLWTLQRELSPIGEENEYRSLDEDNEYRNLELECLRKAVSYLSK